MTVIQIRTEDSYVEMDNQTPCEHPGMSLELISVAGGMDELDTAPYIEAYLVCRYCGARLTKYRYY